MSVSKGWCFTLHNYTEDECVSIQETGCRYIVYGKEVAPTTGTR